MIKALKLTAAERSLCDSFLESIFGSGNHNISEDQYWKSFSIWGKYSHYRGWYQFGGGTNQIRALSWYHWKYRPGSTEGRPLVILRALLSAAKQQFVNVMS